MKKLFGIFIAALLFISSALQAQVCSGVSAEVIPMDPQNGGSHNYFGVRVTISEAYSEDVTVTGYIYDEGSYNEYHPFTLTISTGNLSNETATSFYETGPETNAQVMISSVSPCPPDPLIQDLVNSADYSNVIDAFINNNFSNLTLDLQKATVNIMQNENSTPVITLPFVNNSNVIIVSVEATKIINDSIKTPNNSLYLIMLRDFSNLNTTTGEGTISLYDLSYDGYKFAEATISDDTLTNCTYFDMPIATANQYSSVITSNSQYTTDKLTPGQAQCDYNHNGNISYGECYKCYNSACGSNPNCSTMCYLFGDVIGWVWSPRHIPFCQIAIGLACIYISIAY